ncbi:MAG: MBL fold metallo-hydrolase [Deltaproteobacteria bacterium]|nr:MBL fold metallo-hydrolase [Deltaproteobacteria bacterium]
MKGFLLAAGFLLLCMPFSSAAQAFEKDLIQTSKGPLEITFIGHGSLMFGYEGKIIHVDPYSELADYGTLPKAHLILLTHEHRDHLDLKALQAVRTPSTEIVLTEICARQVEGGIVMKNGDRKTVQGLEIEAVPAYNLVHMRSEGQPFHPRGAGNGYVITFGDKKVYVAGDTEDIPEMKALKGIHVAFLPMNLPYTMTPEMTANAARSFRPAILYPYHFGNTDTSRILELLKGEKDIEVRIRNMK